MVTVELLKGVIRENDCIALLSDTQYKCIAATDSTRRGDEISTRGKGLFEAGKLGGIDSVGKCGIDNDGDLRLWLLSTKLLECALELCKAGKVASLSRDI
jgi:hypothetical protein